MGKLKGVNCAIVSIHALMAHISLAGDQTVQSIIFEEITITAAASSNIKFVFAIGNPKFVRNLKLRAVTGKPNT